MSDLLEKFAKVKVSAASRIPEDDAAYCEAEQTHYQRAHKLYTEFRAALAESMRLESEEWKTRAGERTRSWTYCESYGDGGLGDIDKRIKEIQTNFLHGIVYYFADKYNVELSNDTIEENLGFKAPKYDRYRSDSTWEAEQEEYNKKSTRLLHYNEVVDEILLQLGGLSFADKAVQQIKDDARKSANNDYHHKRNYEVKKKVITFDGSFSHRGDDHHKVLRALWHFNTGRTSISGYWSSEFDKRYYSYYDTDKRVGPSYEFEGQKVCKMRYFKSGRWDITFDTVENADTFARAYLGY